MREGWLSEKRMEGMGERGVGREENGGYTSGINGGKGWKKMERMGMCSPNRVKKCQLEHFVSYIGRNKVS